ncbi:trehalose-phosphatase [Aquamicrobium sp. LC103]|uniref:trehalose-phosphatase n=1 Tax=Aquamicrobium sp. LC103 TaxID=1120658 RepID=UPI0010C96A02|nr:trehalose-phosphatase [Aquamicrobium sp. LC103]TKT82627.1 trehalose-phosphatase [Aquamicrobium sp. LC103]
MPADQTRPDAAKTRQNDPLPEHLDGVALFLDIDGTLLDIASAPDAVAVEPGLPEALGRLSDKLSGALALITGRPVDLVDRLFPGNRAFVSGLHGAELRDNEGNIQRPKVNEAFERAREKVKSAVSGSAGVIFEDKGAAFAAHYRLAPERERDVGELMAEAARLAGDGWTLQTGKCVVELRPRGRDKGDALRNFMAKPPFRGRHPLAVGDDVTDETMFEAANGLGGRAVRVGEPAGPTAASGWVEAPADIRAWIARISA